MNWPPKFINYSNYKNELLNACNAHPDFEQWLMRQYYIKESSNCQLYLYYPNHTFLPSVQNLKEEYYNEMNRLIHEKIFKCAILDIHVKNLSYTNNDIVSENWYNNKKKEYGENKKLIKAGFLDKNIPTFDMPIKMKHKNLLLKLIDETIKDYTETIQQINSKI